MSDNGDSMFNVSKPDRNSAFSFRNQDPDLLERSTDGDQSARVHPFPDSLPPRQKVGDIHGEAGYESAALEAVGKTR